MDFNLRWHTCAYVVACTAIESALVAAGFAQHHTWPSLVIVLAALVGVIGALHLCAAIWTFNTFPPASHMKLAVLWCASLAFALVNGANMSNATKAAASNF